MNVDVVDTLTNATFYLTPLMFSWRNDSQSRLNGITLPSTMGLQISSVNSAGSGSSSVQIDYG